MPRPAKLCCCPFPSVHMCVLAECLYAGWVYSTHKHQKGRRILTQHPSVCNAVIVPLSASYFIGFLSYSWIKEQRQVFPITKFSFNSYPHLIYQIKSTRLMLWLFTLDNVCKIGRQGVVKRAHRDLSEHLASVSVALASIQAGSGCFLVFHCRETE